MYLGACENQPREFVVRGDAGAERVAWEQKDRAANDHVHLQKNKKTKKRRKRRKRQKRQNKMLKYNADDLSGSWSKTEANTLMSLYRK